MELLTNHDLQINILIGLGFILLLLLGILICMVLIVLTVTIIRDIFIKKEDKDEAIGSRVPRMIKVHNNSNFDNYTPPPCNPSDD